MFQSMKNIQSAFSYVRWFALVVVVLSLLVALYSIVQVSKISKLSKQQMLVMDSSGNVHNAVISSRVANLEVEAKSHITKFHELFFNIDPEQEVIDKKKEQWSYLADQSAVVQYDKMNEQGFFQSMVAGSISSRIVIEEIILQPTESSEYYDFTLKGVQRLFRSSSVAVRNVVTSGKLRVLQNRTENNPHGLMIVNWQVLDNSTLSTSKRYD
jgi:conjugative transposon TraK protein